jgi:hypothetical protein
VQPGRSLPIPTATSHFVNGQRLQRHYPHGVGQAASGLGCFWGAERMSWEFGDGIFVTAIGYAGGHTPNPTYEKVCSPAAQIALSGTFFSPRTISSNIWPTIRPAIWTRRVVSDRGRRLINSVSFCLSTPFARPCARGLRRKRKHFFNHK